MNAKTILTTLFVLCATPLGAQGFAGLGQAAEAYALPDPETRFTFPEDHGAHPEFRIEWWYVTANLTGEDGATYGVQWTLFRNALRPGGAPGDQVWMGHAGLATPQGHLFAERFARGGTGQAGVAPAPFAAWIDEWNMTGPDLNTITLTAQGASFRYDLDLAADRPFVPQGADGYSVKSAEGQASHYYSQPFYQVTGTLTFPDREVRVSGQGWLDREWSSQPLAGDQTGWDWISLHLESGEKLMGFQLRDTKGGTYTTGTWITANGTPEPLGTDALRLDEVATTEIGNRSLPTTWDVTLPAKGLEARITVTYPDSWMGTRIPYWEGPVAVTGSHKGVGYLEMSGY
ncbi:MAG: iron ABC transporter permease [Silicimonas sp.]|nr:iron ABC transporter permease [Silicimonas sp.]